MKYCYIIVNSYTILCHTATINLIFLMQVDHFSLAF